MPLVCVVLFLGVFNYRESLALWVAKIFRLDTVALLLSHDDVGLRHLLGNYYFNGGKYDLVQAGKYYKELIDINPTDTVALYQLARIEFVKGDNIKARNLLNQSLAADPEWKQPYYMRGLAHVYLGEFAQAARDFEIFIAWKPEDWGGYNDLAWAYLKDAKYEEAWLAAEEGLQKFPDNLWLNNTAGVALWNLGRLDKAEHHLMTAQESAQNATVATWRRAYLGNDPATYEASLDAMRDAIDRNLEGVRSESGRLP